MKANIKIVLLAVISLTIIYILSFFNGSLTGKGSQPLGECSESDLDIDSNRAGYCLDGKSFKVDTCLAADRLVEWYCYKGWCKNREINCKDFNGSCLFGACTNSVVKSSFSTSVSTGGLASSNTASGKRRVRNPTEAKPSMPQVYSPEVSDFFDE